MSAFQTKLILEDDGGLPFTLFEPLVYQSDVLGRALSVPAGFKTDLASIPQVFWRVLPPVGKYDAAAVVHDFLYQHNGVTRAQADATLSEAMAVLGTPSWQRAIIYAGVRVGGWVVWNRYRKA
jgi:hypothetical protein